MKYAFFIKYNDSPFLESSPAFDSREAAEGYFYYIKRPSHMGNIDQIYPIFSYTTGAERYAARKQAARLKISEMINAPERGKEAEKLARRFGLVKEIFKNGK